MAQDITLMGASYPDVPSVLLPKTGGGTATFTDVGDTTATAADVAQGTYFYTAAGVRTAGTSQGVEGSVYQDQDGFLVVDDGESSAPQGTLSITANGSYDVADYAGADVDIPVGMSKTDLKNFIERTSAFTDIEWPDGMTKIGSYAFAQCDYFNPSNLPSGITVIGDHAFYECDRFNPSSLPDTLVTIETYAFSGCRGWTRATALPSGVTSIGTYAFNNCVYLPLTSLPSGITSIQSSAFIGCTKLALTSLPSGVTTLGSNCFSGCSELALTSLPNGITSIPSGAFNGCSKLALTSLPSGVTSIGSNAFRSCTSLTSISCNGVITKLDTNAFNGNTNLQMQLTSVSFPNMALTSNLSYAFGYTTAAYACQLLEFCDIGSTTGIAASAFANCYSLETLVLRKTASVCSLANVNAFTNTPMSGYDNKTGTVYVPEALIASYQTATNWSTLYNAGTVTFAKIEGSDYELD